MLSIKGFVLVDREKFMHKSSYVIDKMLSIYRFCDMSVESFTTYVLCNSVKFDMPLPIMASPSIVPICVPFIDTCWLSSLLVKACVSIFLMLQFSKNSWLTLVTSNALLFTVLMLQLMKPILFIATTKLLISEMFEFAISNCNKRES